MRVLASHDALVSGSTRREITSCRINRKPSAPSSRRAHSPSLVPGNYPAKTFNRGYVVEEPGRHNGASKMAAVAAPDELYVLAKDVLEQRQRVQVLLRDGIIEDLRFEEGGGGRRPSGRTMMVRESFTKNLSSDGFFVRQDTMPHPSLHTSLWSSLESSYLLEQKPEHRQRNSRETHRRLVKVDKVGDHGVWSSDWSVDTSLGTQEVAGPSDVLIDEVDQPKPLSSAASLKKPKTATILKPKRKYVKKKKVIEEVKGNVVSLSGVETKKITKQRSLSWHKEGTKSQSHAEDGSPRLGLGNLAPKGGRAPRRTPSSKAKVGLSPRVQDVFPFLPTPIFTASI